VPDVATTAGTVGRALRKAGAPERAVAEKRYLKSEFAFLGSTLGDMRRVARSTASNASGGHDGPHRSRPGALERTDLRTPDGRGHPARAPSSRVRPEGSAPHRRTDPCIENLVYQRPDALEARSARFRSVFPRSRRGERRFVLRSPRRGVGQPLDHGSARFSRLPQVLPAAAGASRAARDAAPPPPRTGTPPPPDARGEVNGSPRPEDLLCDKTSLPPWKEIASGGAGTYPRPSPDAWPTRSRRRPRTSSCRDQQGGPGE